MDSAGGNLSKRDIYNQAVLPVKRPANIFDDSSESIDRTALNAFNQLLDYIGVQPGKKCRVEDCTVDRILTLTDGDVDGDIISDTVVSLLAKHCKPLIDAGMVGRILPPLYSFKLGKNVEYVRSQKEFYKVIMKDFVKSVKIGHEKLNVDKKFLADFIDKNFEYVNKLDKLNKKRFCGQRFLEFIIWNYSGYDKISFWKKIIKKKFGNEITVSQENGHISFRGDAYGQFVLLDLDERFDHQIRSFKEYQNKNEYMDGYTIDGDGDKTIYDIMLKFEQYKPKDVVRIKGLGEIDGDELGPLCLDKDKREVIIFKFNDINVDMHKLSIIMSTNRRYTEERGKLLRSIQADDLDIDT